MSFSLIIIPLTKMPSRKNGRSVVTIGRSLGAVLLTIHSLVSPTQGPLVIMVNFLNHDTFLCDSQLFKIFKLLCYGKGIMFKILLKVPNLL